MVVSSDGKNNSAVNNTCTIDNGNDNDFKRPIMIVIIME